MKVRFFSVTVILILGLVAAPLFAGPLPKPVSGNAEAQKLIDEAWDLYKAKPEAATYQKCAKLLEEANRLDPDNHMILTDLARYHWNYGDYLPKDTEAQQEKLEGIYTVALGYADQSLAAKETAGGHYWYAVSKAASLEFSNILSQAAAFPSLYSHSEKVKEIDQDYYYGASGRLWSEILVRVPKKVVEMVGWDVAEAIAEIDTAIANEPKYVGNYTYKARFLWKFYGEPKKDEALTLLDTALKVDPAALPDEVNGNKEQQAEGKELWKEITGKEYPNK